ncbi:MAG TPA: NADH-quinone oxidoreductase subunit C [Pseudolabrys sp.]|nr:NADH-quinone oxidoreductase subunit C [Pseudolabrys sp.]
MSLLKSIKNYQLVEQHRPWPRMRVNEDGWREAIELLNQGRCDLLGLWGDAPDVHMALFESQFGELAVLTHTSKSGRYPSVGAHHPPAIRLERAIRDLFGLEAIGSPDSRPWLDLGFWDVRHPLGNASAAVQPEPYAFLPSEGEALHQIPVGPIHAGIIEPGHFRFTANGEHVVRLEERLGWVHKGIESLMTGATLEDAAKLASRTSGDSTVAIAFAFAQASESALNIEPPPRATHLRGVLAELERLANHFGDIGAICNDASFSLMHAQCGILRERTLRAANASFGHRLMMDVIIPGGLARDIAADGGAQIQALLREVRHVFPRLIELYENTASLQDRTVTTGIVKPDLARQFGAPGYVGRASNRNFDARRTPGYAPYDNLSFEVPVLEAGDVNARLWIRIREVEQSLSMLEQLLSSIPHGPVAVPTESGGPCEGAALVEAFRGDVLVWLRTDESGRVARCHIRDASWFQWPLLETAIEGNIVADFPLCNKSFNCSYSGHDL